MKHFFALLFTMFIASTNSYAVDFSVRLARFYLDQQPYVESYFHVVNSTVNTIDTTSKKKLKILVLFKKDQDIVQFDQFILENSLSQPGLDFVMLKRYAVKPGKYNFVFEATDLSDEKNFYKDSVVLDVLPKKINPFISDIQLYSTTTAIDNDEIARNGLFYEQIPFSYVNPDIHELGVYSEAYNTGKLKGEKGYFKVLFKQLKDGAKTSILYKNWIPFAISDESYFDQKFDISMFPSGQYMLQLGLAGADKVLLDSAFYYFIVSNPTYDQKILNTPSDEIAQSFVGKLTLDELNYALRAIHMNVKQNDVKVLNEIINNTQRISKENFLYNYYKDLSPVNPEAYYTQYMEVAKAVDKKFKAGMGFGFETDRGIIFMKYGKPSDLLNVSDDPVAPPYEIWVYYSLPKLNQGNVKFLFYNPFLDDADYRLLTSNARGEIQNRDWKKTLYNKATSEIPKNTAPEDWDVGKNNNRHAEEWFDNL